MNASDYGLPQNRERIFFVCFRNDLKIKNFSFPQPHKKKTALYQVLQENPKDAKTIERPDTVFTRKFTSPQKNSENIFGEIEHPNRPIQIGYVNKGGQGERIYSPYGHAITLSAYGGGAGAKTGLYFIENKIRKLSPRECARVQGFPETFQLHSSVAQNYKQFGNSVAVNVLVAIIKEIYNTKVFAVKKKELPDSSFVYDEKVYS